MEAEQVPTVEVIHSNEGLVRWAPKLGLAATYETVEFVDHPLPEQPELSQAA